MARMYIPEVNKSEFRDACGIGFIAELNGKPGKRVIDLSIKALNNMSHRGASAADDFTGDGSGILTDIPFGFFDNILKEEFDITVSGGYGISMVFSDGKKRDNLEELFAKHCAGLSLEIMAVRNVPVNPAVLGKIARENRPEITQLFFKTKENTDYDLETLLYILRKNVEKDISDNDIFICSLSSRTIVYKGLTKPDQLYTFYNDLSHSEFKVKISLFHERFSTNTRSTWDMAQPFRMIAHNGEINTIKGNRLWMQAREPNIGSEFWGNNMNDLRPVVSGKGSDSFSLDNAFEFLVHSGKSPFHSIMMLIPEPYRYDEEMNEDLKNFYIYHENHIEPWDGPAAIVFTDGRIAGARLDRNGLRPLRYTITRDGLLVMASEAGVIDLNNENILKTHHMKSGENFALNLDGTGIISNEKIIKEVTGDAPYTDLVQNHLKEINRKENIHEFGIFDYPAEGFDKRLRLLFGFDKEDTERFLAPMSENGREPVGSMGDDTPIAAVSKQSRRIYDYFKQYFAQVTNPPIDPIREKYVMSLQRYIGYEENLLSDTPGYMKAIRIESPVLSPREVNEIKKTADMFPQRTIDCRFTSGGDMEERLEQIKLECEKAVAENIKIIFLSDENTGPEHSPVPMLLAVAAVHRHLVQKQVRTKTALLCFTGDVVEDHHIACLIGFGASAVYPYMAYELIRDQFKDEDWITRMSNYRFGLEKGLYKIMAKMGISTISSYHGSMLFHGIGLSREMVKKYFPDIKNKLGGIGIPEIVELIEQRRKNAFGTMPETPDTGRFKYKKNGELHGFSPEVFRRIQQIANEKVVKQTDLPPVYIRDLMEIKQGNKIQPPEVQPKEEIIKRFGLGAISFGAISEETHRTLAKAASILNIRSNTGEGGEHKDRYSISNPRKDENCYVKQVASGRFGVTPEYLSAAKEIQIKMAQGAKPGEGGQLPGEKVTLSIAADRHTTPGVPLISPPPHHDIYSIEDIAQLIYDLKQVNPRAKICVKLVSQYGVGIIACGVVKAGADIVLISGNDGGTGASPLGSLKHTGLPWELGLSETHRALLENGLRNRVILRVDGGLKTGKDVVTAALLGAEEFDFGTAALVSLGCIMVRKCHSNTCPAGIATQDEKLRKKFKGKPENLVNYLVSVAEEVREILAAAGYRNLDDITGRNELLLEKKGHVLELGELLAGSYYYNPKEKYKTRNLMEEEHLDDGVIEEVRREVMTHGRATVSRTVHNTDRSIGAKLSGLISFLYGSDNFKGSIQYRLEGTAGQSLGAFLIRNIELRLSGAANDFVGKGLAGGLISIRFPGEIREQLDGNTLIGNVALYGATGGELYVAGQAGERFAVRNSGASAVVEGTGNHCCEYMTRGTVVVLGATGRNFGAGMTGGTAFVYNSHGKVEKSLNNEYVRTGIITPEDENLLSKMIHSHGFHTGSHAAKRIIDNWDSEKVNFTKVVPVALDILDYNKIYEEQLLNRKMQLFNE